MKSYATEAGRGPVITALIFLLLFAVVTMAVSPSVAHEGHDHGTPAVTVSAAAPRVEASSESFELVGIVHGGAMRVYLDRFASNEPVTTATIDVTLDADTVRAEPQPDGSFLVGAPWLAKTGRLDLVFAVATDETSDLLIGTLDLPAEATGEAAGKSTLAISVRSPALWVIGFALFVVGVLFGRSLARRRSNEPPAPLAVPPATSTPEVKMRPERRARAVVMLAVVAIATAARVVLAHGDEDHGAVDDKPMAAVTSPAVATDSPRRLSDGSLFVPKPTQRLLTIRTQQARTGEASRTSTISGRVIADPTAGGRVQAAQGGRVEPLGDGLPVIGQRVLRGQVLVTVSPVITTLERGGVREQLAQIESSIAIAEQRVARLSQLQGSVPQREIDEARRELDGLRQRRRALGPSLAEREVVRASASGVISVANVVTGQLIESGAVLFEIVDPAKLWVEAIAYDAAATVDIRSAVATTADGATLPLELIGQSLTLRQQAVPVLFRITRPSPTLKVGTPVSVILQEIRTDKGIVLPTGSVVGAANGEDIVFEHVAAERFVPRPIRLRPLDGDRVEVLAGIGDGARVVTAGADLLSQIR
ncbi:MAG: HlyD family efflux transporter periplasmic adaptor subunit [Defluviicoccus sp.]|nr:HlyD family efflux transporter periplasmic adaptor subunit [Defluviicoccus sp.]MDG4593818.1 HlyD family efflux transporter periplasmic adaptor subunit [Defluviicoccus sp.]MDG4601467.1 HlyD family efflux transporter periplasmic adaptor subunit [Defluviicoccus sp.]MDS4011805.1 HlyD family efflux transporter periplasmic adaptor subunit [Defluviicoccus sp.]MDS4073930.1 HlyD family efflux transporter periplasmic adaptor subunit [Defluviicoccus sp.]